jgi:hypothetical protein
MDEPQPFSSRRGLLITVGIIQMAIGGFCAIAIPLVLLSMVAVQGMPGQGAPQAMPVKSMVSALLFYAFAAALFIVLGFGTVRTRRWARAVGLVLSWPWLVFGFFGVIFVAVMLPQMFEVMDKERGAPSEFRAVIGVLMVLMTFFIYVVLPGFFAWVLTGRNARLTCETADPYPAWTDRCPLPVLGLSVWFAVFAAGILLMGVTYALVPFFGHYITGLPAVGLSVVWAGLVVYMAIEAYRLKEIGWWGCLGLWLVMIVSWSLTLALTEYSELLRHMGIPPEQAKLVESMKISSMATTPWWSAIYGVAVLGYMIYVRRYFGKPLIV